MNNNRSLAFAIKAAIGNSSTLASSNEQQLDQQADASHDGCIATASPVESEQLTQGVRIEAGLNKLSPVEFITKPASDGNRMISDEFSGTAVALVTHRVPRVNIAESNMTFFHPSRINPASVAATMRYVTEPSVSSPIPLSGRWTVRLFQMASRMEDFAIVVTRIALIVVLIWIGGLKAFDYEAEGIVPFVANSPLMSFFYRHPAPEYQQHMNAAGELVSANHEWHEENGTYAFAHVLGSFIVAFGLLIALHPWFPGLAAIGSFLVFLMSFVTLSFLFTTPEAWVPALGSAFQGFPLLATPGLLVLKDCIMMGAALVTMADSAKAHLAKLPRCAASD